MLPDGAPELDRDDRRGEVGLDEDAKAIGEFANLDLGGVMRGRSELIVKR